MKRLIFLNRFFSPDHSATSQIVSDLAFHLAASGFDVHVITSRQLYDDPKANLPARATIQGVIVHRVFSTRFGRSVLVGRLIDYFSFYLLSWFALRSLTRPGSIVIAKTDPPLVALLATGLAKRRRAHLVNWLQDIFPEVAIQLRVPLIKGPIGRVLVHLRDRSLRLAAANVVIGTSMSQQVLAHGASPDGVHIIPNWCDDERIVPVSSKGSTLRWNWSLPGKFVVGYSGNLGRAHDINTVLKAAERLKDNHRIVFLFIGGGHRLDELKRETEARDLQKSFRFMPYQSDSVLMDSLSVPDVHWISLKPELEGLLLPSKFYGAAAAGRPIIFVGSKNGELAQLIRHFNCGVAVEEGDAEALAETLEALSTDPDRCAAMGRSARQMLDDHFSRRKAFEQWRALLNRLAS